jgi:Cys-tRNA(Pro)/Cys-tRNA(Cys) deacylase
LEAAGIGFELREYEWDENDLSAETVAAKVGLPAEQVFKTLVVRGDSGGVYMAVIPGNAELDLKAMAKAVEERKVDTVAVKELESLTGYIRGGVTAMGAKKEYPVVLDELAQLFDIISVSAGRRGLQILLAPESYVGATGARYAGVSRFK